MRRPPLLLMLSVLAILGGAVYLVSTLIGLLFESGLQNAILPESLPSRQTWSEDRRPIPKIIHQTWKNETIPEMWSVAQYTCRDLHPDYKYILWTDESSREFIKKEYPWFLETFDSYPYNIERADVIRYFALYHFGGIYLDLDLGCHRRLDPLRSYSLWLRRTDPTGISNDAMGSARHHPFLDRVLDHLQRYAHSWILPYLTVMLSTGPLFLSVMWKEHIWSHPKKGAEVSVLMPNWFEEDDSRFFSSFGGSSWHRADVAFIFWAEKHWLLLTVLVTTAVLSIFASVYYISRYFSCGYFRRLRGWRRLNNNIRRSSSHSDSFMGDDNMVVDRDWIEMDYTEKGAQSPHME